MTFRVSEGVPTLVNSLRVAGLEGTGVTAAAVGIGRACETQSRVTLSAVMSPFASSGLQAGLRAQYHTNCG